MKSLDEEAALDGQALVCGALNSAEADSSWRVYWREMSRGGLADDSEKPIATLLWGGLRTDQKVMAVIEVVLAWAFVRRRGDRVIAHLTRLLNSD